AEIREYPISNITKTQGHFTHLYVEKLESGQGIYAIRWKMEMTCHGYKIFIGGPSIGYPDESYFKKFKAGDMALPEPYKSIYDSVRCTEYKMPIVKTEDEDAKPSKPAKTTPKNEKKPYKVIKIKK